MIHHVQQGVMFPELLNAHHLLKTQTDDDMIKASKLRPTSYLKWLTVKASLFITEPTDHWLDIFPDFYIIIRWHPETELMITAAMTFV